MAIGNPIDFKRYRFHIDFSQMIEYLHLLLTATHSTEPVLHYHAVDYRGEDYRFVITKSRSQITKDYTGIAGQAYEITSTLRTPRVAGCRLPLHRVKRP